MIRHVEVEERAAVMAEHDEGEEEAVSEGGNEKEVDGDEVASLGGEKGTPRGRRVSRRPVHVLGDREFGDVVAEEGKFRPDASAAVPVRNLIGASVAVAPRWVQSSTDRGSIFATKM
jgi:hypothetical protein